MTRKIAFRAGSSQARAERWARQCDYARERNGLPPLEVEFLDGEWCAVNPNIEAPWHPAPKQEQVHAPIQESLDL